MWGMEFLGTVLSLAKAQNQEPDSMSQCLAVAVHRAVPPGDLPSEAAGKPQWKAPSPAVSAGHGFCAVPCGKEAGFKLSRVGM